MASTLNKKALPDQEFDSTSASDLDIEVTTFNAGDVNENHWDNAMKKVSGGVAATALALGAIVTP